MRMKMDVSQSAFYTASEVATMLGMGRSKCYSYLDKVMAVGKPFTVIRIDKLYKIPKASFDAWITKICDNKRR